MGDCFEANYRALLEKPFDKGWYLCHGIVTGQSENVKGIRYMHAWLENGSVVCDYSNGKILVLPKETYYNIGKIKIVIRYTVSKAMEMTLTYGTYGCWDTMFDEYP
jgi:hypothetical protein